MPLKVWFVRIKRDQVDHVRPFGFEIGRSCRHERKSGVDLPACAKSQGPTRLLCLNGVAPHITLNIFSKSPQDRVVSTGGKSMFSVCTVAFEGLALFRIVVGFRKSLSNNFCFTKNIPALPLSPEMR